MLIEGASWRSAIGRFWRRLPRPFRALAHRTVQAVARSLTPIWVGSAWRRGAKVDVGDPIVVAGLMSSSIGIGEGARLAAAALRASGSEVIAFDLCTVVGVPTDLGPPGPAVALPRKGPLITHLNPRELALALQVTRARFAAGRRHVGFWAWELPIAPEAWRRAFNYVDEVWCPSTYSAAAIASIAPRHVPVSVIPHPLTIPAVQEPFPDDAAVCRILVALDLRSTLARKNPEAAIAAYRLAIPEARSNVSLILKVGGVNAFPEAFQHLCELCAVRKDIQIIDTTLSTEAMRELLGSCQIVLSLHRAEGFGLLLGEAMLLGKVCVATAWSGNMDFMTHETAALVRYHLVPVADAQGMYQANTHWAEPDVEHAAELLQTFVGSPHARRALGARARAHARAYFDQGRIAALMVQRLQA